MLKYSTCTYNYVTTGGKLPGHKLISNMEVASSYLLRRQLLFIRTSKAKQPIPMIKIPAYTILSLNILCAQLLAKRPGIQLTLRIADG